MHWNDLLLAVADWLSVRYILISVTLILATVICLYFAGSFMDVRARRGISTANVEKHEAEEDYFTSQELVGNETLLEDTSETAAEGFIGQLKAAQFKILESQLTADQLEQERRAEEEQLAEIFELLRQQEEELNLDRTDESDFTAQMALYRQRQGFVNH